MAIRGALLLALGRAALAAEGAAPAEEAVRCPGTIDLKGYGDIKLVNAKWNVPGELAGNVAVGPGGVIQPHLLGRTYFGDACRDNSFENEQYTPLPLLGKTFSYTTDIAGAGCGCNAAVYLTSLHQSEAVSQCEDHYCDANTVCGLACPEIDLQEANKYAWHSTLHVMDDRNGVGGGYGGGGDGWNGPRDFGSEQYGPGGKCVDTNQPFRVAVSFPLGGNGRLAGMDIELSQQGKGCNITHEIHNYHFGGRDGVHELTDALSAGMTPIISYWRADDMLWMDGPGKDGRGPCPKDANYATQCHETVKFYDFKLESIQGGQHRRLRQQMLV